MEPGPGLGPEAGRSLRPAGIPPRRRGSDGGQDEGEGREARPSRAVPPRPSPQQGARQGHGQGQGQGQGQVGRGRLP